MSERGKLISQAHSKNAQKRKIEELARRIYDAGQRNFATTGDEVLECGVRYEELLNYGDNYDSQVNDDHDADSGADNEEDGNGSVNTDVSEYDVNLRSEVIIPVQRENIDNSNFGIYQTILQWIINERTSSLLKVPSDFDKPLFANSEWSKGQFATSLSAIFSAERINPKAQEVLLQFMQEAFPNASIPAHITYAQNIRSDIAEYVPPSVRLLTVSICPNKSCCAFFSNLAVEIQCPCCFALRFTACTRPQCKGKPYEMCQHPFSKRVPLKTMHYRPLLGLIIELLETEGFLSCLLWSINKPGGNKISDIMHGANVVKHLAAMHLNFSEFNASAEDEVTEVNILISLFYDGAQVYTTKCSTFWPLFCSILNLPPNFRNKVGVGTFLVALYTGVLGTGAESYLLDELFLGELLAFEAGQLLTINNKKFFVQIRLIQHCLDTKALGKMLNVQEAASLSGCPLCYDFQGVYRSALKKVVNGQHRKLLPITSVLRVMGNSEVCCPKQYYAQNEDITMGEVVQASKIKENSVYKSVCKRIVANLDIKRIVQPQLPRNWLNSTQPIIWSCNMSISDVSGLRTLLRKTPTIWFHGDADSPHSFSNIQNSLHFVHCDLRAHCPYKKITMQEFVRRGRLALRTKEVQSGVKGEWPYSQLKYADIASDVSYDPFHAVSGVCAHILSNLKGTRMTQKVQAYCTANNVHPGVYCELPTAAPDAPAADKKKKSNAKKRAPWIISEVNCFKIDAHVNCILVPKNHSDSFQVKNIFQQTGNLRGHDCTMIFTALIWRINMLADIEKGVKCFLSMFGSDLNELLAPEFDGTDVFDDLLDKVCETASCNEGVFPDSESTLLWHQLIHLPKHILEMGPLAGYWTYSGERAMARIKEFVPDGGQSMEKTVMEQYSKSESAKTKASYNFQVKGETLAKDALNDFFSAETYLVKEESGEAKILFNNLRLRLFDEVTSTFCTVYTLYELNMMLWALRDEVVKQLNCERDALQHSAVFRLCYLYKLHTRAQRFSLSVYEWFVALSLAFEVGLSCSSTETILGDVVHYILCSKDSEERFSSCGTACCDGYILHNDLKCAKSFVDSQRMAPTVFLNAIIHGVRFSGRGVKHREQKAPSSNQYNPAEGAYDNFGRQHEHLRYKRAEPIDSLTYDWRSKDQYSSWCKFRVTKSKFNADGGSSEKFVPRQYIYAQLNYVFYVDLPEDRILHGVPFANIVQRDHKAEAYCVDSISCDPWSSCPAKPLIFIPLTNAFATPILVEPTAKDGRPVCTPGASSKMISKNSRYCADNSSAVSKFYLLPMYPMNNCIVYDPNSNHLYNKCK